MKIKIEKSKEKTPRITGVGIINDKSNTGRTDTCYSEYDTDNKAEKYESKEEEIPCCT